MATNPIRLRQRAAAPLLLTALACSGSAAGDGTKGATADAVTTPKAMKPAPGGVPVALDRLQWLPEAAQIRGAEALLDQKAPAAAVAKLAGLTSPAASLTRARAQRELEKYAEAKLTLEYARQDGALEKQVALERGLLATATGDHAAAAAALLPLLDAEKAMATRAALPLTDALLQTAPQRLVEKADAIAAALPVDVSARSRFLAARAAAHTALKQPAQAKALLLRQYLEEPVAPETPAKPPKGVVLTSSQQLARARVLLKWHRNERVITEMSKISEVGLSADEVCLLRFGLGLAHRKLHHYSSAEKLLTQVQDKCADQDLARRAMYINAKVISIRSGMRAVPVIEAFAKRFAGHTMVDDVLFWAGDLHQRRSQFAEAEAYYERIENLPVKDDQCAEARWRRAWTAYRKGDFAAAKQNLERTFNDDGCVKAIFDKARARYWLGRIAAQQKKIDEAKQQYAKTLEQAPLGFYAQMALSRLLELDPASRPQWEAKLLAPKGGSVPPLCPGWLVERKGFDRGMALLLRGLGKDAAAEFLAIQVPEQDVLGKSHAISLGLDAKAAKRAAVPVAKGCGAQDPGLLLTLLLDKAGDHRAAHWRLRTTFAEALERFPSSAQIGLFRAAYPMAYSKEIGAAEKEHRIPELFLQALAREESAFDAYVVSWAGAYGLTQLLLSTAQRSGEMLKPKVKVRSAQQLLNPQLNARLGGAFMASLLRRFGGYPPLALVGYNASQTFGHTLWKRHQTHGFDRFAEEVTIRETRGYVKRVLKTYGVYRWLYTGGLPVLPIALEFPKPK